MRRSYSKEKKLEIVQQFKDSGLSFADFSQRFGINYHTLRSWCVASNNFSEPICSSGSKEVGFVEVKRSFFRQDSAPANHIITIKKDGMEITLPLDTNLSEMKTVFEALSAL